MYKLYFANSWKQATILFYLIGLLFISSFPSIISELRTYTCSNASTSADGSTFSSNLDRVMGDLVKNAPQTGFNTSLYGQSPNRIYGLLQCIGNNISQKDCSMCSQQANDSVQQLCGNNIGGQVLMDNCFLRYENYSFFSKLDTVGSNRESISDIVTSNLSNFRTTISNFLSNLSDQAYDPANKGFAEGSTAYPSVGTIYGLVQCWRDISVKDCRSCLQLATNNVYDCCSMKQGAQSMLGSCTARYELYPFFLNATGGNITNTTSPPAASGSSGANPNGTSSTTSNDSSTTTLLIILSIIGGVIIALILCLFSMMSKLKSAISQSLVTRAQNQNEGIHENNRGSTRSKFSSP